MSETTDRHLLSHMQPPWQISPPPKKCQKFSACQKAALDTLPHHTHQRSLSMSLICEAECVILTVGGEGAWLLRRSSGTAETHSDLRMGTLCSEWTESLTSERSAHTTTQAPLLPPTRISHITLQRRVTDTDFGE